MHNISKFNSSFVNLPKELEEKMVKFKPGENVLVCKSPLVALVKDYLRYKRCHYCFNKCSQLKKCSKCLQIAYCSSECQAADWNDIHKLGECKLSQKVPYYCDTEQTLIRYILKVTFDPSAKEKVYNLWDGLTRKIPDLLSHHSELKAEYSEFTQPFLKLMDNLKLHLDINLTLEEIWQFYGQFTINASTIIYLSDTSITHIASALYVDGSAINHSCRPNAEAQFSGRNMVLRAMADIDTSLDEPTISYIPLTLNREERRKRLQDSWFFHCECKRCDVLCEDFDFDQHIERVKFPDVNNCDVSYWEETIKLQRQIYPQHSLFVTPSLRKLCEALFIELRRMNGHLSHEKALKLRDYCAEFELDFSITFGKDHHGYESLSPILKLLQMFQDHAADPVEVVNRFYKECL